MLTFDDGRKKIVFLDQNYATPSDGKLFNCKPINPQKYFNQMNDLFLKLEKRYNCDVVIALHPTAVQYDKSNPYNGRKCYHGLSSVLVKNSIGVVAHCRLLKNEKEMKRQGELGRKRYLTHFTVTRTSAEYRNFLMS